MDGLGLIAYHEWGNDNLKVAHCSNLACSAASISTIDSVGSVGDFDSLTIGADGMGLISYFADSPDFDLKVAHCSNVSCTAATTGTIDSAGAVGAHTSITTGADGLGLVSYYAADGAGGGHLKVAHCSNVACSTATSATVDGGTSVGTYPSITIGSDGLALISYHDDANSALKVAHCADMACSSATTATVDANAYYSSIIVGPDGLGLISYQSVDPDTTGSLKVAHCSNVGCSAATTATLDTEQGGTGAYNSVAIGSDGLGLMSYFHVTFHDFRLSLRVAHCSNLACSTATTTVVDNSGDSVGEFTSLTIGADGLGLMSYRDQAHGTLKVAHCSNVFCVPYFRRR